MKTAQLILVRHGESTWNKENRFTGWHDVDLSEQGVQEAKIAGREIAKQGLQIDQVYTSVLNRALQTHWNILQELNQLWLPVEKHWRLNERHYGDLTGLNKSEVAQKHGEEQVKIWRRSFAVPPPPMKESDPRNPKFDPRYKSLRSSEIPMGESLLMTVDRVLPYWSEKIEPLLKEGKCVMVVAHGNSLRALIYHLEAMSPEAILEVNVPTAIPLLYTLDSQMKVLNKKYLADPEVLAKALGKVADQGKAK